MDPGPEIDADTIRGRFRRGELDVDDRITWERLDGIFDIRFLEHTGLPEDGDEAI